MSRYTTTIKDILQRNAGQDDITTLNGTYNVAMRSIFSDEGLAPINPDYHKNLVVSFCRHYQNDEITDTNDGTIASWRMLLDGKLWENADYINGIYAQLENQVFSQYRVVAQDGQTHTADTGIVNTDELDIRDDRANGRVSDNDASTDINNAKRQADRGEVENQNAKHNSNDDTLNISNDILDHKGVNQHAENGQANGGETTKGSKSELADSYGESKDDNKRNEDTQSGNINSFDENNTQTVNSTSDELNVTNSKATSSTETDNGTLMSEHNHREQDDNGIIIHYDTPQGSLDNLRYPGGLAKGRGVDYTVGQSYNYMTDAQETDASSVGNDFHNSSSETKDLSDRKDESNDISQKANSQSGSQVNAKTGANSDQHMEIKNGADNNIHSDKRTDGRVSDEAQSRLNNSNTNSESLTTDDTSDVKKANNSTASNSKANDDSTREVLSNDIENSSGASSHTGLRESESSNTLYSVNDNRHNHHSTNTGLKEDKQNIQDKLITWEVLHRSENILNRMWYTVFDDLFLALFN